MSDSREDEEVVQSVRQMQIVMNAPSSGFCHAGGQGEADDGNSRSKSINDGYSLWMAASAAVRPVLSGGAISVMRVKNLKRLPLWRPQTEPRDGIDMTVHWALFDVEQCLLPGSAALSAGFTCKE
jgi:hypothetical protein